jgi:hypothetical protein
MFMQDARIGPSRRFGWRRALTGLGFVGLVVSVAVAMLPQSASSAPTAGGVVTTLAVFPTNAPASTTQTTVPTLPPLGTPSNPSANVAPDSSNLLVATNYARSLEGVGPMDVTLAALDALPVPEQIFVIENLERIGRGEPPISAMTSQLNSVAQSGANAGEDPSNPVLLTGGGPVIQGGSIWEGGTLSTLEANYLWMYQDGWGGSTSQTSNEDCTSASASGCWGHRDIILTEFNPIYCAETTPILVMGAAENTTVDGGSIAATFESTCILSPSDDTVTWAQAEQAIGVTPGSLTTTTASSNSSSGASKAVVGMASTPDGQGYWLATSNGGVFSYGDASFYGSMGGQSLNKPIVGMAATPDGKGYWLVATDGGIFSFGDAQFYGSTGSIKLNKPIVGMTSTPDGKGYWFVAADGGIFAFGDAAFHGSTGSMKLNKPIVGMTASPGGGGYWLVASDGGIFAFGNAAFHGSTGSIKLNKPIVGMAATPDGQGYWLVASDGGIFSFGDAQFHGSAGSLHLDAPIVGMASTSDGQGYWLVASDGGIFTYGNAAFYGSTG